MNTFFSYTYSPLIVLAIFSGCVSTPYDGPAEPIASLQAIEIPTTHSAVQPVSRINPNKPGESWEKRHVLLNERAAKGDYDLVFIGDSITHGWEGSGKSVWEDFYSDRKALNLGIGGDRTEHVLWRLDNGNIEDLSPKLAVIMIGTNNFRDNTAEEIGDGIISIVKRLNARMPEMNILILGIFPRFENPHPKRRMLAEASLIASSIADGKRIHYLDIGDVFLDEKGTLPKKIMPDFLHPNKEGYQIWAEAIEPTINNLLR
jgi:lysophospholipase L1-like esterase